MKSFTDFRQEALANPGVKAAYMADDTSTATIQMTVSPAVAALWHALTPAQQADLTAAIVKAWLEPLLFPVPTRPDIVPYRYVTGTSSLEERLRRLEERVACLEQEQAHG